MPEPVVGHSIYSAPKSVKAANKLRVVSTVLYYIPNLAFVWSLRSLSENWWNNSNFKTAVIFIWAHEWWGNDNRNDANVLKKYKADARTLHPFTSLHHRQNN